MDDESEVGPRPGPDALYGENPTPPPLENGEGWAAEPLLASGHDAYADGEYLYQDFVYDDHGADTRSFLAEPPAGAESVGGIYQVPTGDVYYPNDADRYGYNAADLLEFRARPTDDGIAYRVTLNTMLVPDAAAVAIGIDTSGTGDPEGGRTDWGYGLGDLGSPADHVLVTWGTGAELDGEPVDDDRVSVDVERNQIEVEVPLSPGEETWRHYCLTGLWDDDAGGFRQVGVDVGRETPGGRREGEDVPPVFNVGFRFDEPCEANVDRHNLHEELFGLLFEAPTNVQQFLADVPGLVSDLADPLGLFGGSNDLGDLLDSVDDPFALLSAIDVPDALDDQLWRAFGHGVWRDHAQALALAERDVSRFHADVDFGKLREGVTESSVPESGHLDLLYPSRYEFGQGIDPAHNTFEGRVQPYSVYVPESLEEPAPMVVLLHSLGCNHNQYELFMPKLVEQLAEAQGTIVFTPQARGTATWYQREGELDVFEAWRDLETRYEVDRDRVSLAGYSMGGFGTLLLAEKHPDLFARGFSMVGTPSEDPLEGQTDNLFGLPRSLTQGLLGGRGGGEVLTIFTERPENALMITANLRNVPMLMWNGAGDALAPLLGVGNYARRLSEQGYRHQLDVFPTTHMLPAVFDSWDRGPEYLAAGEVDHTPQRVTYRRVPRFDYEDLDLVHDGAYWVDDIDLRMGDNAFVDAVSLAEGYAEPDAESFQNVGARPQPYVSRGVEWSDPDPEDVRGPENTLELKLRRVDSVTLYVEAAGLDPTAPLTLDVDSDGPTTVRLVAPDGEREVTVTRGEETYTVDGVVERSETTEPSERGA
ncbi:prolyl oligopeptidase family serine peptidase [Halorarius halobius]|uniref:prolyl oligopeptidase family serine peptidase n=1 Tax=Halorarius halobius TaxID=2962671 RepID=UPI0020CB7AF5|nr:prolyl oligopeptidase family serine peptidase [Halorarius halobius]